MNEDKNILHIYISPLISTMTTSKNINLDKYLKEHNAIKGQGYTHTRIGDSNLSIYGGSYNI